jgi:hypothetical protein
LKEIYRDEGDEVIRHLLVEHVKTRNSNVWSMLRITVLMPVFRNIRRIVYKTPSAAYALFVVRMIIMFVTNGVCTNLFIGSASRMAGRVKGGFISCWLQLSFEVFLLIKTSI